MLIGQIVLVSWLVQFGNLNHPARDNLAFLGLDPIHAIELIFHGMVLKHD